MRPSYIGMIRLDSRGMIIAVKDTMKTITMQVKQETEVGQTLWIPLNNQKKENKIKVGVIYAPQEGLTPNKKLLHTSITEEIIKAKDQQSIISGDFNAKIGDRIKGNMSTVTKEERQLIKMIGKYDKKIVNKEQDI